MSLAAIYNTASKRHGWAYVLSSMEPCYINYRLKVGSLNLPKASLNLEKKIKRLALLLSQGKLFRKAKM
jgi:hypothetical protein